MGWSAIKYTPYNSDTEAIYALNGTYRKRIEETRTYEWGIDPPIAMPILYAGTDTGLTGDYNAVYTYARAERRTVVCESNAFQPATEAITLANTNLRVIMQIPLDPQVNLIRLYRTIADGSTYYYDSSLMYCNNKDYACCQDWEYEDEYISGFPFRFTVPDDLFNSENTFSWEQYHLAYAPTDYLLIITSPADHFSVPQKGTLQPMTDEPELIGIATITTDAQLGDEIHTTHNRPPSGSFVFGPTFNGIAFIIKDHRLHFSLSKQVEYFPLTYYLDISSPDLPGLCGVFFDRQPFVLTKNQIIYIYGTSATTFLPKPVSAKTGAQGPLGALAVEGFGIFHVGSDGLYLCVPSTDSRFGKDAKVSSPFDPIFQGETIENIPAAGDLSTAWLAWWENKLYFGYPDGGNEYPEHILVFWMDLGKAAYFTYGKEIACTTVDEVNNRLLAVDKTGYTWVLEDPDTIYDDETAISWELESKEFTLQTRAHFPRWVKYDVNASNENCSATGEVLLDGVSIQSHTLTRNRWTRRRLIVPSNGERCSMKISGTGPIEIYAIESE